jgi:hypothetical protein
MEVWQKGDGSTTGFAAAVGQGAGKSLAPDAEFEK